jgi:uncharacterized membrane protein HdeD (DUF308 family)
MKILQSSIFRALCAIIVGALLIMYSEEAVTWLTICIGIIFLISGLISCITYFASKRQSSDVEVFDAQGQRITMPRPAFPIVGIGSIILGALLALAPNAFINGLMYALAAILILGALNQYFNLGATTRFAHIGCFWWVFPSIILLVGLIAIVKPSLIASAPLYIIGWCMLVYGVVDLVNDIKIHQCRKAFERNNKALEQTVQTQEEPTDAAPQEPTDSDQQA